MRRFALLAVGLAAILGFMASAPGANAQYPPPNAVTSFTATDLTPPPGGSTTLSFQLLDENGDPVGGVLLTFTIIAGPESATIGSRTTNKLTNSQGVAAAVLNVGNEPGATIVVDVTTPGRFLGRIVIQVEDAPATGAPGGQLTGAPGQVIVDDDDNQILPPNTGDAGLAGGAGSETGLHVLVAAVVASAAALLILGKRGSHRSEYL